MHAGPCTVHDLSLSHAGTKSNAASDTPPSSDRRRKTACGRLKFFAFGEWVGRRT